MTHTVESSLLRRICSLFESGKLAKKKKRKAEQLSPPLVPPPPPPPLLPSASAPSAPAAEAPGAKKLVAGDFSSIYDDDIVVTKYVPVGALEEGEVEEGTRVGGGGAVYASQEQEPTAGKLLKDLFDKRASALSFAAPPQGSSLTLNLTDAHLVKIDTAAALLKPVKELLQKQAAREAAAKERSETRPAKEMLVETDVKGGVRHFIYMCASHTLCFMLRS